jgi:hypothetical protein
METGARSIAHFYRDCEIWPRLNPAVVLKPAIRPIHAETSQHVSANSKDRLHLSASLHRLIWVAGQRCFVKVCINNQTKKPIKRFCITLCRKITVFKAHLEPGVSSAQQAKSGQTSTLEKEVAESILLTGERGTTGRASAKGWFGGAEPGKSAELVHALEIPVSFFPCFMSTKHIATRPCYEVRFTLSLWQAP